MIQKKYYTINETLTLLTKARLTIDIVGSLIREKLIHPIIYINSLAAHACVRQHDEKAIAVGQCFLSAYWDLGNEMIAIVDNLIHDGSVKIHPLVKVAQMVEKYEIFSWQCDDYLFKRVPPGHAKPQPFSDNLDIRYFVLIPENYNEQSVTLKLTNIVISSDDFEFLKKYLIDHAMKIAQTTFMKQENPTPLPNLIQELPTGNLPQTVPQLKQRRISMHIELIKKTHASSRDKTAIGVWNELKNFSETDQDEIEEMDDWGKGAQIKWVSGTRPMGHRRFQNIISQLNNA